MAKEPSNEKPLRDDHPPANPNPIEPVDCGDSAAPELEVESGDLIDVDDLLGGATDGFEGVRWEDMERDEVGNIFGIVLRIPKGSRPLKVVEVAVGDDIFEAPVIPEVVWFKIEGKRTIVYRKETDVKMPDAYCTNKILVPWETAKEAKRKQYKTRQPSLPEEHEYVLFFDHTMAVDKKDPETKYHRVQTKSEEGGPKSKLALLFQAKVKALL